eukprot:13847082-Heterocapsa_arctica.AAC.1
MQYRANSPFSSHHWPLITQAGTCIGLRRLMPIEAVVGPATCRGRYIYLTCRVQPTLDIRSGGLVREW